MAPLLELGARVYSPELGTFTAEDTVAGHAADPASMNRYLYAEADPTTLVDPDGHSVCTASNYPNCDKVDASIWSPPVVTPYCESHPDATSCKGPGKSAPGQSNDAGPISSAPATTTTAPCSSSICSPNTNPWAGFHFISPTCDPSDPCVPVLNCAAVIMGGACFATGQVAPASTLECHATCQEQSAQATLLLLAITTACFVSCPALVAGALDAAGVVTVSSTGVATAANVFCAAACPEAISTATGACALVGRCVGPEVAPISPAERLSINKGLGDAWRDQIAGQIDEMPGITANIEVSKWTPWGRRVIDVDVQDAYGNSLGGIEAKYGNSPYLPLQRSKDLWLRLATGYRVTLVRYGDE